MPIYEYRCTNCGHRTEIIQKMTDEPAKRCHECHTDSLEKMISAGSFRLTGGGYYETDFKNKNVAI